MDMVNDVLGPGLFNQGKFYFSNHLRFYLGLMDYKTIFTVHLSAFHLPFSLAVRLAMDRETGRQRGFGHIDFKGKCP
jgi:hypothetical protein